MLTKICSQLSSNIQDSAPSDESDIISSKEKITFDITFLVEEWELIKPRENVYNEKKRSKNVYNVNPLRME